MSLSGRFLVVDDDPSQREMLAGFLRDQGADVREAGDGREALATVQHYDTDVILTDLRMPDIDGLELMTEVLAINPEIRVVVVTAYGTVEGAVECLKVGAADYLLKPLDLTTVKHVARRALEERHLRRENRELRERLGQVESLPGIITAGGPMTEVLSTAARVAESSISVLLLGESGTGKEVIARAIHATSPRSAGPFVAVNATALSPTLLESELFGHEKGSFTGADRSRQGRFEGAAGGTLFLDEIGDLPGEIQVKLLRVLQEKTIERVGSNRSIPVDVRLVSATNSDLPARVADGRFREDLYYRLAVVTIEVPPLRYRRADIALLVDHFLTKHSARTDHFFSREAMDALVRYDYPGNVRELENIVQRCLVLARESEIRRQDLPPTVQSRSESGKTSRSEPDSTLSERLLVVERQAIAEALALENGNQTRAAERLGISERTMRYKLAKIRNGRLEA